MREIKFRAWDTVDREMWEWPALVQSGFKLLADPAYVVMQYTGLKDKNGKEIYEGDVVKFAGSWPFPKIDQVVWWDGSAGFSPFIDAEESDDTCSCPKPEECEVIGNIYENPELLP